MNINPHANTSASPAAGPNTRRTRTSTHRPGFQRTTPRTTAPQSRNIFQGHKMDFEADCNNRSNSVIPEMVPSQSGKICDDLNLEQSAEVDSLRNDDLVNKGPLSSTVTKAPLPAAATLATDADDQVILNISIAKFKGTPTQHDAIFNSKISFPLNLTRMLEGVKDKGLSHIVHWSDDENSFVICDIDLFLQDVLPKFFKSSEKTKIRSFYRKLNRWGFSMARKNAYNPNNVWHHPEFNRVIAVKSLIQAFDTGKAVAFLSMSTISRGKKRSSVTEFNEIERGWEDDDAFSTTALSGLGVDTFDIRRPMLSQPNNILGISSMPTLPSQKSSMARGKEHGKKARTLSLANLARKNKNQPDRYRSVTSNNLLQYSQSVNVLGQRTSNAQGLNSTSRGGGFNATFDLLPSRASGMYSTSRNFAPGPNILAQSARDMLRAHSPASASFGGEILSPSPSSQGNISSFSLMGNTTRSYGRQKLQSKMTEEEDNELVAFFGKFAENLPPPKKDDEEGCATGEPDPLPHNF